MKLRSGEPRDGDASFLNDTLNVDRVAFTYGFADPWWEGARTERVVVQYCKASGQYQHVPRPASVVTGRIRDIEWREIPGTGEVFSWTITRRAPRGFEVSVPYAVVCVTFDVANVNHIANFVNGTVDDLRVGARVAPYWAPLGGMQRLLMFQPEGGAQ